MLIMFVKLFLTLELLMTCKVLFEFIDFVIMPFHCKVWKQHFEINKKL